MSEPITGPWAVSAADYFADTTCVSSSMLRVWARSVVEYHQRFVTRTLAAPKASAEMRLGTLLHAAILEPEAWSNRITTQRMDGRTKAGKLNNALMEAYAEAHPDALLTTAEEDAVVQAMREAIFTKPEANEILALPGVCEQAIRWYDMASGLWCKAKLDRVCEGIVVDLKTTSDLARFAWQARTYQYERQAAHYIEGAWHAMRAGGPYQLIVVQSSPPHEVRMLEFGENELRSGRIANRRLLAELAECQRTEQWRSRYRGVETLTYPKRWMED